MKLISLFAIFVLVSCAQQSVVLDKKYLHPYEDFDTTTVVSVASLPIKLEGLVDQRKVKSVGIARTGAQFKKTPVFFDAAFVEVYKNHLRNELSKRNVLMVNSDQKAEMNVMIKEFWTEEILEKFQPEKAGCKISLEVQMIKGEEEYRGVFWTQITSPGDLGDATEKLAPTLASCMNSIVEKIVNDQKFIKFIEAKPII
ncbi:MAG: hypothetical protein KC478_09450 [Bacteriovoracaceae bacterium]|nr:hypothetical protein [Bacteriovoracaceae bacterium]